jgi:hypothetical protein
MLRRAAALTLVLAVTPSALAQEPQWVIPPGMEGATMQMFNGSFAGGACTLGGAAIDRELVAATYRCRDSAAPVVIEARHPSRGSAGAARTERFALAVRAGSTAPTGLLEEVAAKVRQHESAWRWSRIEVAPTRAVDGPIVLPLELWAGSADAAVALTPEQRARYLTAFESYRSRRFGEAVERFGALAADTRCCGVLGTLAASVAALAPTVADADRRAADADAGAPDGVAHFLAGVYGFYAVHRAPLEAPRKVARYAAAARHLAQARAALGDEPRLLIYLAVCRARSGDAADSLRDLDTAATLAPVDPEVHYFRAALLQHSDPRRALDELDAFLTQARALVARGAILDPGKFALATGLRGELAISANGDVFDGDLFDRIPPPPLPAHRPVATLSVRRTDTRGRRLRQVGLGAALLLAAGAVYRLRAQQRRSAKDPV